MTFTLKANWIKEIREGKNDNWNYNFKEYVFNENYTKAAWLRIPANAPGIKAMLFSNNSGIEAEYSQVYLDNDGTVTTLFDADSVRFTVLQGECDELAAKLKDAKEEIAKLNKALENRKRSEDTLQDLYYKASEKVDVLEKVNLGYAHEIIKLKAKLYDLTDGADSGEEATI